MSVKQALIVDDSPTCIAWIRSELRKLGFVCSTRGTVREGLEAFKVGAFDLVIADYELPGISGVELVKALRRAGSKVPIVMVSSHELRTYAAKLGCDGFAMKGDVASLRAIVSRYV